MKPAKKTNSPWSQFMLLCELGRISNLPSVTSNVIAAWFLNNTLNNAVIQPEAYSSLLYTILGGWLLYVSGTTLNDGFDVKFDKEHRPERAIPSGRISQKTVCIIGFIQMLIGIIILIFSANCSPLLTGLLCAAILFYDIIHKKWKGSIIIMGACRLLLWLTAASANGIAINSVTFIWSTTLFIYILGISFIAINEHKLKTGKLVGMMLALIPVIDALSVSNHSLKLALALVLCIPFSIFLQKQFAAT